MKHMIILFIFLISLKTYSQEIEASVSVDLQQIPQELRINVQTMGNDLQDYINNTKFTQLQWDGPKIPVDISIILSGGQGDRFSGRIILTSQTRLNSNDDIRTTVLKLMDSQWAFEYQRGAFFSYNPLRYDPFITLIDFYMNLVIGADMDTYEELGGTPMYQNARQICLLGASNNGPGYKTNSQPGEFTRYNLVNEMVDLRFEGFRMLLFSFFYDGLDLMVTNKEDGMANLVDVISEMADYKENKLVGPSVFLQAFFDAKSKEIASVLTGYKDEQVFKDLMYLDPSNSTIYQEAQNVEEK